ncbi:MAG: 50S ribosomal protein L33 [Sandaracinaceae bacterium]|nr:50S ribosomal protein L33 [Sandaracinaceae bacterium]
MPEKQRVALVCEECGARNYKRTKPKRSDQPQRLTLRKHCPHCKRHTVHRESK